jgi:hypothetical protein
MDEIEEKIENHPLVIAARRGSQARDFITIAEAAAIVGVSLRTARRWQAADLLPRRTKIIRTFKYDRADVMKLRDSVEQRARGQKTE